MKVLFAALASLVLALLYSAPASQMVRELAAGRPRTIVCYGTSLTANGTWVAQMQAWLAGNYRGPATVVNSGLSGLNSASGVAQLSAKVLAYQPDTVFIEFAMNDAFLYSDGTPQLSVADARANLESMIASILAQNPRAEIILQTMNPAWDSPNGANASATLRPNLPAYYQMYRDVAQAKGLQLIDHYPDWLDFQATNLATFQADVPDGTHPNAAGTQLIITPVLQRALVGSVNYLPATTPTPTLLTADVCVYGGTAAGVTAAVQAARQGLQVVLISPDPWVGGITSNGLGYTDIGTVGAIGGMAREFYHRIYTYYQNDSAWVQETRAAYVARASPAPSDTLQEMFSFEPKVARQTFEDFLAETGVTVVSGRLRRSSTGVKKSGAHLREIMTDDGSVSVRASVFIDATYEGDLMAAAGVSYTIGRESNQTYGETLNGLEVAKATGNQLASGLDAYVVAGQPASGLLPGVNAMIGATDGVGDQRLMAYGYRMCLTDNAANSVAVPKPDGYQESDYELLFRTVSAGQTTNFFKVSAMPNRKTDSNNSGGYSTDFIGGNYSLAEGWNYAEADYNLRDQIVAAHYRFQLGMLYALQHSARVGSTVQASYLKYGLPADEFPSTNHWPGLLYIREARRMVNDAVITQPQIDQASGTIPADPVGEGSYTMDSHNTQRYVTPTGTVRNEGDVQVAPAKGAYGISYRALVPRASEADNLIVPVCLAASHIAYGSIRMEPVFMILGQSAGAAAARSIYDGVPVQQVNYPALQRDLLLANQVLPNVTTASTGEIIVDDAATTGVTITGTWASSTAVAGYYGSEYLAADNTASGKSVRFTPTIATAGPYQVFARWTINANRATNVPYDIVSTSGTTTVKNINQQANNNTWVSLGTYNFAAGTAGSVTVRNDGTNGYVIADAIRFLSTTVVLPVVNVRATVPLAVEGGALGVITVTRDSTGASDLVVHLAYGGTATPNTDYRTLPATLTIPAGQLSASVAVSAWSDSAIEGAETVIATLATDAAYTLGSAPSAAVTICDPPLQYWKATNFSKSELQDPALTGDTADFDSDGVPNLLEFALGTDPRQALLIAAPTLSTINPGTGPQLRLYYTKATTANGAATFSVQQSTTLLPESWTHSGVSDERYDATSGLFYQGVPVPTGSAAGTFLRLQITTP